MKIISTLILITFTITSTLPGDLRAGEGAGALAVQAAKEKITSDDGDGGTRPPLNDPAEFGYGGPRGVDFDRLFYLLGQGENTTQAIVDNAYSNIGNTELAETIFRKAIAMLRNKAVRDKAGGILITLAGKQYYTNIMKRRLGEALDDEEIRSTVADILFTIEGIKDWRQRLVAAVQTHSDTAQASEPPEEFLGIAADLIGDIGYRLMLPDGRLAFVHIKELSRDGPYISSVRKVVKVGDCFSGNEKGITSRGEVELCNVKKVEVGSTRVGSEGGGASERSVVFPRQKSEWTRFAQPREAGDYNSDGLGRIKEVYGEMGGRFGLEVAKFWERNYPEGALPKQTTAEVAQEEDDRKNIVIRVTPELTHLVGDQLEKGGLKINLMFKDGVRRQTSLVDSQIFGILLHEDPGHVFSSGNRRYLHHSEDFANRMRGNRYYALNTAAYFYLLFAEAIKCDKASTLEARIRRFVKANRQHYSLLAVNQPLLDEACRIATTIWKGRDAGAEEVSIGLVLHQKDEIGPLAVDRNGRTYRYPDEICRALSEGSLSLDELDDEVKDEFEKAFGAGEPYPVKVRFNFRSQLTDQPTYMDPSSFSTAVNMCRRLRPVDKPNFIPEITEAGRKLLSEILSRRREASFRNWMRRTTGSSGDVIADAALAQASGRGEGPVVYLAERRTSEGRNIVADSIKSLEKLLAGYFTDRGLIEEETLKLDSQGLREALAESNIALSRAVETALLTGESAEPIVTVRLIDGGMEVSFSEEVERLLEQIITITRKVIKTSPGRRSTHLAMRRNGTVINNIETLTGEIHLMPRGGIRLNREIMAMLLTLNLVAEDGPFILTRQVKAILCAYQEAFARGRRHSVGSEGGAKFGGANAAGVEPEAKPVLLGYDLERGQPIYKADILKNAAFLGNGVFSNFVRWRLLELITEGKKPLRARIILFGGEEKEIEVRSFATFKYVEALPERYADGRVSYYSIELIDDGLEALRDLERERVPAKFADRVKKDSRPALHSNLPADAWFPGKGRTEIITTVEELEEAIGREIEMIARTMSADFGSLFLDRGEAASITRLAARTAEVEVRTEAGIYPALMSDVTKRLRNVRMCPGIQQAMHPLTLPEGEENIAVVTRTTSRGKKKFELKFTEPIREKIGIVIMGLEKRRTKGKIDVLARRNDGTEIKNTDDLNKALAWAAESGDFPRFAEPVKELLIYLGKNGIKIFAAKRKDQDEYREYLSLAALIVRIGNDVTSWDVKLTDIAEELLSEKLESRPGRRPPAPARPRPSGTLFAP